MREQYPVQKNRLRHAAALLDDYLSEKEFPQFDRWLSARMKAEKSFGKKDRAWYSDTLFAVMRHALLCALVSEEVSKGITPDAETLISRAAGLSTWNDIKSILIKADPLNIIRTALERTDYGEKSPFAELRKNLFNLGLRGSLVWQSIPLSFEQHVLERVSDSSWSKDDLKTFLSRQEKRPPLWIRFNHPDQSATAAENLKNSGFSLREYKHAASIESGKSVYASESYSNGLIEIQDYASQMIGIACDVHPGMYVWDACAGGGGKTLHIASCLNGKGAVYASDIRDYKLEETKLRARRASFSNVRTLAWNGNDLPAFPKEVTSREGFHRVLVDAPCSSSGTWRRNPDGKFRQTAASIRELTELQLSILTKASEALKDGGLLIYATCSFLPCENESVAQKFTGSHPDFQIVSMTANGNPQEDSDTTFTAVIRKSSTT